MKTKKKNKKKISKVLFNKVARVASLATTVVASEILTSEKAEASITIGETAGSPNNQSVKKTSAAAVSTAIAIGNNANASNSGSAFAIAIGGDTTSTGNGAISIGKDAQSLASSGVAVGYNSKASGGQAVAIGGNIQNAGGAQATGDQSISIGGDTIASGSSSIAIGGDDLNQANSIAGVVFKNLTGVDLIGTTTYIKTESGGAGSIAIGVQSTSSGHLSTAFGTKTKASGAYSTALGVGASSEGEGSIALGGAASSKGKTSIAIGTKVKTVGESATSIGYGAEASSKGAVAIGLDSKAGDGNAATGTAGANGINAVAIGTGAQAIAKNTISIGTGNVVSGVGSGAIGDPTTITGTGTYSLGNDNGTIAASNSGVFGNNNNIKGATSGNRVIGNNNTVEVTANNALIFGNNAGVSAANGIAIGEKSASTSEGSIAFGLNSKAGNGSGATFGLAKDAIAIGTNSSARGDKAVAIGKGTQANHDSNIAIGNSAETGRDLTVSNYDIKNISIGYEAGKGMNGQFNSYLGTNAGQDSKGDGNSAFGLRAGKTVTGNTNTAIGMDSGQNVKASSNTAIGLNAGQNVTANGGGSNVAIGTNAGQNVTTTSLGGGDNIAIGTNAGRNVTSSIGHNTAVGHSAGQTVTGTNNVAFGSGSGQNVTGDNNTSMGINAGIGVKSSSNVSIGSDSGQNTDGVGNTAIGYQAGQKVTGGHNISMGYQSAKGLNGGSNTIIGFQAGQEIVGGNNIIVGTNATKKVTVDNVVSIGTNSTASTNNSVAVGSYSKATGNAAIAIGQGSNASKDNSMAIGNRSTVNAVKDVAIGSDSSTSATTGVSKATITVSGTGKSITYGTFAGSNPDAAFSVGSAGKERQIQNVAAGRVTATSTDAINGSQLFAVANELGKTWKANAGGNLSGSATSTQVMPGDEVQFVAGKNLEVEQNLATGSQKYTYSLKKDVDLGSTGSLKAGPVTINNNGIDAGNKKITNVAPGTADTDAANVSQVKAAKTTVSSDDNSITVTETTKPDGHKNYDLSVDVTKLDAANKSLSNINNDGNKVISNIARKSIDVVAGTNIKDIVKNDVQNSDGTTTTTYTINANGARVVAGDGVTVATGTPGSNNITDYTVSVKNTTLTAAPGSTTVTAGDNNSYAKAGDVATAITNVGKASKTTVTSNDSSVTVVSKVDSGDGHVNYDLSVDTSKVAANTNLTYKANSGTGLTTTLANGLDFKDGDNTVATVGPNGEVKYSLNPTVAGINSITTNGGNTVINDNGITTPKVTINNAPTAGTDATNKDYVDSTKTKVTSNDSSVVVNKTTSGNQDVYDLSVDVTKLDAANKSLSNINNDGNKVISNIARKSIDVVAGTNIKDIVKNDVQNSDGTTTTTYTINANGARVVAGDGVTVATGTPGSDNITDYTVSVKNTTLTAAPGSTTVTAGDNNSYAKAGDVATAITKVGAASKTELQNGTNTNVTSHQGTAGQTIYQVNADKSEVAVTGTGLSLDSKTTTDSNGTKTTKYTLGLDTTQLTTTGGKVDAPTDPGKVVTAGDIATAINSAGWNVVAGNTGTGTTSGNVANKLITPGETVKLQAGDNLNVDQSGGIFTYSLKKDISLDSVTTGDTKVANGGITITNPSGNPVTLGPSGLNNGGNTITGVGNAVNDDDAVNLGQLKAVKNNPLKFGGDSGTVVTRKLGEQLDIKGGATGATTSGNIAVIADGNNTLNIQLAKNLTGLDSISTNGGNTVINDNGITTPKVTINNAPTAGTDATNKDYVDSTKTKVTSNDSSVVINKTTNGNQDVYDLSVDVIKLDAANKSLSNINNAGNKVISNIARKSIDVVAGTNIKDIVKNDVQNSDGTTTTTYTINANGARVVAGDGVTVATGTPGSNNITDYTVSVKNTTLTAAPGSTTVTAGDNNSYAKAGDVATAITNVGKASKTTVTSNDSSVTVVSKVDSGDGHVNYDLSVDTSKVAANTNLTYKANSGTGLTTTLANGLDFKDGDNTKATVGPNGEVKYSLNPTVAGINSITTNGGNTVINDNGITTPKVTINNAPTAGTDATNKDYVDSTKTKVTSNDSSVVVNKTTNGNQDIYDLSVDVTKLDAANKSLSNINNDGNKVISGIARKSIDVVAGTNIKDIVKNDVQNSDGTTTTTYTINANGARVVAGDGVTVATGTPGSNNITDYTVSVKNTTLTAAPGSTTVTAGDNNSYAKAGDVATAITNVGKASKTTVTSNDSSVTVVSKVDSGDGHVNYDLSVDTSKVAANTNLTYKANSGTGLTTTLANGLDFKDGDNTVATVGPNGEVKYSLNPTVAGINSITTNGGNTVINDNGVTTPSLTLTNSTPLTSSTGGKVTVPAGTGNQAVTGQTVANAINKLGDNTINLKASDGNITTKQSLNKDGGLEFNITGSNGITTTASGDTINVTIAQSGLTTSTAGGKTAVTPVTGGNTYATAGDVATAIQNAVNNSGWNAVAGSTGTGTTSGSVSNKLITPGETVKLQAGDNLNVDQSGGTFTYSLKKDISLDSVTTGDTKVANGGITIGTGSNQVSLTNNGLNNGGNKITNVAAGTNKNDAVNVGQLNAAKTELENGTNTTVSSRTGSNGQTIYKVNTDFTSIADAIGGNTKFDPTTGKIDTSAANIGGTGQTNISNAVKAAITTVSSNDASVTVNKVQKSDGHYNYDLSVDTNKIAANTNLTYKANSGTGLTTTLANGLDFKDGDNTVATVGPNGEVKYSLNPTVAGINSITTNGGNTVINDNGVTTPSLTLTNSTPLTSSTGGKVTVPAGTGNQAVTGQTVANAINKLGDNTINLKASDGNITTKQSLNKDGGLEFNITGSNGITTTASGDTINVTIAQSGLNTSTTGGKTTVTPVTGGNTYATAGDVATAIQNAVNNSGWNTVAGSTGTGTTSGSVSNKLITPGETVKLQAGDNLNVDQSGGTFTYSLKNDINVNSITAGNNKFDTSGLTISDAAGNKAITTPSGTTYINAAGNTTVINPTGVVINKSAADPSKSVSLTDNGLDNGGNKITNVAAGVNPTDAVNVSQLDKAINKSTYNGPVVYTNAAGEKIVKANNGNYYKALDVDSDGNPLPGKLPVSSSDIQHSLLNADGSTTNPSTLDNVGKGKISSSSKQAINGSQLNNLGTQLGLTVDPSGTGFSNPTFAGLKNVNGSTGAAPTTFKDAVDQTIAKVNEGIIYGADNNTAGTRQQLGSRLTVESGDFASGGVNYKGQNLETSYVSDGAGNGKIIVGITENPEFNSVKAKTFTADDGAGNTTVTNGQGTTITDGAGNKNVATAAGNTYTNAAGNTTTVNSSGVTINKSAADPSKSVSLTNSGLDNGGNRITNIAAGVAPTDAVNVSQLGNAVNNLTTAINASKSEVVGGTNTNVTSSTGSNGQIVYKVDADGTTVSGGSSFVSVTQGTKDANNITDYKVDLAQGTKDKLNSIGTGNIAAGDNNTVTGSTVHNYIQNNPLTYTDDNGTTVTRNLGQNLNIMGRATGPLTTGNIGVVAAGPDTLELRLAENVDLGPNGRVTIGKTVVNDDGIKITGGPSVTSSGIDAGGKKVTNIAEGDISPTSNDAVTGRQVYNAISAGAADKATRAELAGVNNNLTAGIAGVAAMANLPQINDSASNRFNIAVAGGAYKNGRAMALGFSGVSDGGRFVYRASASLNNKRDVAVGLGVGYQFGKRDVMPNELDRMKSMVALIEEQKDSYSRQLKQQLEQESRKNQENSELIRQLMQEVQELKSKSNVSNRSNRS